MSDRIIAFGKSDEPCSTRPELAAHLIVKTNDVVNGNLWRVFPVINVDRVADIPSDYPGPIGVPISIMDKFNMAQFAIITQLAHGRIDPQRSDLYRRIVIRHLHPKLPEEIDIAQILWKMGIPVSIARIAPPESAVPAYARCQSVDEPMTDGRKIARERVKKWRRTRGP